MENIVYTVLFDLDNTIIKSYDLHFQTWSASLLKIGINLKKEDFDKMCGSDSFNAVKFFHPQGTENEWSKLITAKDIAFEKEISNIQLFEGLSDLISLVKELGCKIGIVTSSSYNVLINVLSSFNLVNNFDVLISSEIEGIVKPNPNLLYKAIKKTNGTPNQTLYIGDTIIDMEMAVNATIECIGISEDSKKSIDLLNAGAITVSRDLFEVSSLINYWVSSKNNFEKNCKFLNQMRYLQTNLDLIWRHGRAPMNDPKEGPHWTIKNSKRPVSIGRVEGYFLYNLVRILNYKNVFEIGTGFGYSSWWIGSGLKKSETTCWLGSIDNYSEGEQSKKLLDFAIQGSNYLNLSSILNYFIGQSPADIDKCLGLKKIDFAFIDGNHHLSQPLLDYKGIQPYMNDLSCIVFHDNSKKYTVNEAVKFASKDGWIIKKFSTSCKMVLCLRSSKILSKVEIAYKLARRLEFIN